MTTRELYKGILVRLTVEEPDIIADLLVKWRRDSEYARLLDNDPARMFSKKKTKEWLEKDLKEDETNLFFMMRTLEDDKLIGFIGLFDIQWYHRDAYVGVGIGEREYWGRGFGTDAMRIILRYAFTALSLNRVTLAVFEYNPRGVRSYEKAGFKIEGRARGYLHREGRRWDLINMGILREEWQAIVGGKNDDFGTRI
jgi:RimJ/RimL family protein N-acetyltransferase